mgnify:CR=1 FL=1
MKSNGSMNRVYRVVWNASKAVWQAVCETGNAHGKEKSTRSLRRATAVASFLFAGVALAAPMPNELPSGGNVVAGSASISVDGSRMDVLQTTQRTAIDWATFNIGSAAHVHFEQPNGGAALNRVLDTNASQIYGKLTSTGQVFLVNPNGVLFAPGAQVDVGGLVASTLAIKTEDFMAGNYTFQGASSNAIINQGNITAHGDGSGGTIALIAAKITNDGTLAANGGNVLLSAGSKVTLDMGGPVKLQIENDTLETLIQNGGAIRADGGRVLLTSQAANTLASSVINNTGVIEAQTLATGEKGEIILFAHDGHMNVGGTIKAEGGFVESSGKTFEIQEGATIQAGHWLIDPVNITIDAGLAGSIETALGSGDVTITTDGGNTPDTSSGEAGTDGDITVDSSISWNSAQKLTLSAHRNILINEEIEVGNAGGELALHYGQGAVATGNAADYSFGPNGLVSLPTGGKFTEKLGTDGLAITSHFGYGAKVVPSLTVDNDDDSLQDDGVQGPFLWEIAPSGNHMFIMQPDGDEGAESNLALTSTALSMSGDSVDYLNEVFDNNTTNFSYFYQTVTLSAGQSLTRAWTYTSTDYYPFNDGSFLSFVNTTIPADNTVKIYGLTTPVMVLGATVAGTGNWSTKSYGSTGWQTVTLQAGQAGDYRIGFGTFNLDDTSYSPILGVANAAGTTLLNGQAFAPIAVDPSGPLGSSGVVIGSPSSPSVPPSTPTNSVPQNTAVATVQSTVVTPLTNTATPSNIVAPSAPPPTVVVSQQGSLPVFDVNGGLAFVQVGAPQGTGGNTSPNNSSNSTTTTIQSVADLPPDLGGRDPMGFMRVFVVGGGLNLPEVALNAPGQNRQKNVAQ